MASARPKPLPRNWERWASAAERLGVKRLSVHTREHFQSGSNVSEEDYLILRVIQPPIGKNANAVRDLGLGGYFDEATNWANNSAPFAQFLAGVESSVDHGTGDMGIFEIPHAQQVELRNLLARGHGEDTGLNAVNEELVNSSLINFLTAISITHPKVQASWTPHRATITADLKRAKLSCQIDGYLFSKTTPSETQILLEAKSEERLKHEPYVSMQEAYEIVASLATSPPKGLPKDRIFLIAQDGLELYISSAICPGEYKDYVTGNRKTIKKTEFLQILKYGPWKTTSRTDMDHFAKLVLAICLRATAEQEQRAAPHPEPAPTAA